MAELDLEAYLELIDAERERRPAEAALADEVRRLREKLATVERIAGHFTAMRARHDDVLVLDDRFGAFVMLTDDAAAATWVRENIEHHDG